MMSPHVLTQAKSNLQLTLDALDHHQDGNLNRCTLLSSLRTQVVAFQTMKICPYREDIHRGVDFGKLFGPQPGIRSFFAADSAWGLTPHDGSPTSSWTMSDSGM